VVVLDPPRAGAGPAVCRRLAAAGPRAVVYVACDPASLARDVAAFAGEGYRLAGLRAFDAFPMTAHVECVALLTR
jgi:tRNA/tmRNA/rRNA uracil-C5-methylase (TrmA/RlmC/RlmD family)